MKIQSSEYIKSCLKIEDCPNEHPEYAFIGRSNVGKSSLVNMLTGRKKLAKTSSKPGKTQTINYFLVNFQWYLVDLPGYGYAKIAKSIKSGFDKIIKNYILRSPNLMTVFVLIDATIPPQKIDLDFINELGRNEIPLSLIFTKTDKITKNKVNQNIEVFKKKILETWSELPRFFISSAVDETGKDDILGYIEETLNMYQ